MDIQINLFDVIQKTEEFLNNNSKWETDYANYAKNILKNSEKIIELRKGVKERSGIFFYMPVGKAKTGNIIQVRFAGYEVGNLSINKGEYVLSITEKIKEKLENKFNYDCPIGKFSWNNSKEAKDFRQFFANYVIQSEEFNERIFESQLLTELEKTDSHLKDHLLIGVRPVEFFEKLRFQLCSCICASEKLISYSNGNRGGIDIIARVSKTSESKLCVIELKQESHEDITSIFRQAIAYSVFLQTLLASKSGNEWYQIFGYSRTLNSYDLKVCVSYPTCDEKLSDELNKYNECISDLNLRSSYGNLFPCYIFVSKNSLIAEHKIKVLATNILE